MREIVMELNKEICPVHVKHAKCKIGVEGVDMIACCKEFRELLMLKLVDHIKLSNE